MKKEYFWPTLLALLALMLLATILYYNSLDDDPIYVQGARSSPTTQPTCNELSYNGEGKNIVFFSSKDQALLYSNYLMQIKPFSENKENFNFYYIDDYIPACTLYEGIALFCYSKDLIKKASVCPSDYIVAVSSMDRSIRSSSYMNVMSLNTRHPLTVFPHEFGHSFANLAEEYTPAEIPGGSKNCQSQCENFDIKDGCYEGCSKNNYYRSIDNGIMRTFLSDSYGVFNEKTISSKIKPPQRTQTRLTGNVITGYDALNSQSCKDSQYYLVTAYYDEGVMVTQEIEQQAGCSNGLELEYYPDGQSATINPQYVFNSGMTLDGKIEGMPLDYKGPVILKVPFEANQKILIKDSSGNILLNLKMADGSMPCRLS